MLNIGREKINRNYYSINLMSRVRGHVRLELYVEIRESELRKHAGRMRQYVEESVKSYAKLNNWEGMRAFEFVMFPNSLANRIDKLEMKYSK